MTDSNKENLYFFEAATMRGLFNQMQQWQVDNQKRLLSVDVQRDGDAYCCIALTNAMEVYIVGGGCSNAEFLGVLRVTTY